MRSTILRRRLIVAGAAAAVALAAVGGSAVAGHLTGGVKSYTGCIYTTSGLLTNVKEGDAPTMPCRAALGQTEIHLSGGDITRVAVGPGLTGGGDNGAVTIGLNAQQSLPACAAGQVPKWSGSGWGCAADNDTTYSAGTGLDLNGTTFSVEPDNLVQNGQSCSGGQFATGINSSGNLTCGNAVAGTVFANVQSAAQGIPSDLTDTQVVTRTIPAGAYVITANGAGRGPLDDWEVSCALRGAGSDVLGSGGTHGHDFVTTGSVSMFGLRAFSAQTTLRVTCSTNDDGVEVHGFGIQAIKID